MAAPYIATIAFTGICYLVNAASGGRINKVSVVMPNGEAGLTVSGGAVVPPHYGFILYLKSQAVPQTSPIPTVRDADLTFVDNRGNIWGVIRVKGETLSFDNTDSALDVASAAGTTGGPSCTATTCKIVDPPAALDKTLFNERLPYSKIVSRKVACPRCTDIPSSSPYLSPTTTNDVIARVDLTGGYLASAVVKECLWDFLPQGAGGHASGRSATASNCSLRR